MSAKRVRKGDYGLAALRFIDRTEQTEEPEAEKTTGEPVEEEQQIEGQTAFAGYDPREAVATETSKGEDAITEPEAITPTEKTEPNAATPTDAPIGKSEPETETPEPIAGDESVQAKPIGRASGTWMYEGETEMGRLYRQTSKDIDPQHGFFEITDTPEGGVVYAQQKKTKRVQVVMQPTQHAILKEISKATGEKLNGLITEYVWRGIKQYYEDFERQHNEQEGKEGDE